MDGIRMSRTPASVEAVLALGAPAHGAVFAHADSVVDGYRDRQQEIMDSSNAVLDRAAQEKRELTAEEKTEVDGLAAEFDKIEGEIGTRQRIAAQAAILSAPRGRQTDADPVGDDDAPAPRASASERLANSGRQAVTLEAPRAHPQPRVTANGTAGFRNFGEFAQAVRNANPRFSVEPDRRLIRNATASTYMQEGVGADGGFAVPTDFRSAIMSKVFAEESLIARTDRLQSSSNTITMPVDMTTPWQASGGIQAYWVGEGATKTQSKPVLEQVTVKLHQLAVLIPVTEELLEDAPALDGYLRRKVPEKLDFKISHAMAWGSGGGQPLGWMNSPALVTQAAEGAQTADTINVQNIVKMFSRMPVNSRRSAVWLIHPDAEPQLPLMTLGNQPIYLPAGSIAGAPFGNLLGRPVIPHQIAETVGDLGDIMFVDLQQYMSVVKQGGGRDINGMRTDVSIHLWFDQDLVAYRFTIRLGGQPWWSTATASRDGSHTMSPFVTLAAR